MRTKHFFLLGAAFVAVIALSNCARKPKKETSRIALNATDERTGKQASKMLQLTKEMFDIRFANADGMDGKWKPTGSKPAIVEFCATWCGPCKQLAPVMEALARQYDGQIVFYKVDIDQEKELANMFGVQAIPSLVFFPLDGTQQSTVGAMSKTEIEKKIRTLLLK